MSDDNSPSTVDKAGSRIQARDIMVPLDQYPALAVDATLSDAAKLLSDWHIDLQGSVSMPRILLALDESGALAGVVRRRDILRGLAPSFLVAAISEHPEQMFDVSIDPNLTELLSDRAAEKLQAKSSVPIAEFVQPLDTAIGPDDPLIRIIQEMVRRDLAILPVIEEDHVIGVVRSVEVLQAVTGLLAEESPAKSPDAAKA